MTPTRTFLAVVAMAALLPPASAGAAEPATTVTVTPAGAYVLGSPTAPHRLVEYVSYTCTHCATFAETGDPALKSGPVARGTVSVEVRPWVQDGFDMVAAVLARCGAASGFFDRHHAIMTAQPGWLAKAKAAVADPSLPARLKDAGRVEVMTLVAGISGLDAVGRAAGVTDQAQAACFADESHDRALLAISDAAKAEQISGTPSFTLDGKLLSDVHSWAALGPRLDALAAPR